MGAVYTLPPSARRDKPSKTDAATWKVRMKKWERWQAEIEAFGGKVELPSGPPSQEK